MNAFAVPGSGFLPDRIADNARTRGDRIAFRFIKREDRAAVEITWSELWRSAAWTAEDIGDRVPAGARVGIACDDLRDFVVAIATCFRSGWIAVPMPVALSRRSAPRALAIAQTVRLDATLMSQGSPARDWISGGDGVMRRIFDVSRRTDALEGTTKPPTAIAPDAPAFIQFSSGTTGQSVGVALSHANLAANCAAIAATYGLDSETRGLSWLPLHHDMGLVGHVLTPMWLGCRSTIMDPLRFLQRPLSWLRLVKSESATIVSAPNFAFELCTKIARNEPVSDIDLSTLRAVVCGGEPVVEQSVTDFLSTFRPCGLSPAAFFASYGLAEATLLAAAASHPDGPRFVRAPSSAGASVGPADTPRTVADLGPAAPGLHLRVLGEDGTELADGSVGEIRISGASVGRMLRADGSIAPAGEVSTGDLGFLDRGRLRVTGRKKDLIILRGQNVYPTDIEAVVPTISAAFAPGGVAAVGIAHEGTQRLVVLAELDRGVRMDDAERSQLRRQVIERVTGTSGHAPHDAVLLPFGALPRTSSGKVRRVAAAELYASMATGDSPGRGDGP